MTAGSRGFWFAVLFVVHWAGISWSAPGRSDRKPGAPHETYGSDWKEGDGTIRDAGCPLNKRVVSRQPQSLDLIYDPTYGSPAYNIHHPEETL